LTDTHLRRARRIKIKQKKIGDSTENCGKAVHDRVTKIGGRKD